MTQTAEGTRIDRKAVMPGDTIAWKNNARMLSYGLVEHTDDEHVHVQAHIRFGNGRYPVRWDKVRRHEQGRELYDAKAFS